MSLRAETLAVAYLADSSVHEQMVRFATEQFRGGHLPLSSWFPFLGLGSPQFLHYQSLPAMITGLIGIAIGPDTAFRWTLYVLLSLWPVSVYLGARMFGAGRPAAGASAAMAPFLVSATGIGYEQHAYVWTGFGVWTQLWASLTLPLAWGLGWRAIRDGRRFFPAIALTSLTIALHFETGYLAVAPLLIWPVVAGVPVVTRMRRAGLLLSGSLLASAWVIVPLLDQREWAATNELLHGTGLADGYGAGRVLGWLVSGQLLDHGRLPVVTLFAALGLALACARCTRDANARALVAVLAVALLLSFGRTTFGALVEVIPGSSDIFFRRFMMGVQLAALLLAGRGAAWSAGVIWNALTRATVGRGVRWPRTVAAHKLAPSMVAMAAAVLVLAPAWLQLGAYDRHNASAITAQRRADATQGAQLNRLIALIKNADGGRVYAGMPSNWGMDFTVGAVPVFKYLDSRDVNEVGYTLRTASLMTAPEYFFDERDPSDCQLFGIHYLIIPSGYLPPVTGHLVLRAGRYSLWRTGTAHSVHIGRTVGVFAANRTNLGVRSISFLRSQLAQRSEYLRVAFDRADDYPRPLHAGPREASPGNVITETDNLNQGEVAITARLRQPGVAVLSVSFDPGWTATVDGHSRPTQMVAPALVATAIPAGTHTIEFRYRGFRGYPFLFALCGLTLAATLGAQAIQERHAKRTVARSRSMTSSRETRA